MTYQEALDFVYNISWNGRERGLKRINELLRLMGSPHKKVKCVHIGGTNGKGSTSAILERILREAGYCTGLYTSPFLLRFNERMRVNGIEISDLELVDNTMYVKSMVERMEEPPTFFETATALGFKYFLDHQCDIVVLEVGMGGRLDATNVIERPETAVITTIGLDHTEYLGRTPGRIAIEKAGIIKEGRPVVVQTRDDEAIKSIQMVARDRKAPMWCVRQTPEFLGIEGLRQRFRYKGKEYEMGLLGRHQLMNAATAIETVEVLRREGWVIPDSAVEKGIAKAVWKGRFQATQNGRLIVDGAHNPEGAESAATALKDFCPDKKPVCLFGCLGDKDWQKVLDILCPCCEEFFIVPVNNPRASDPEKLRAYIEAKGMKATLMPSVAEGVDRVLQEAESRDSFALSAGSLYLASEVLTYLGESNSKI